jgi:hypothetical protein
MKKFSREEIEAAGHRHNHHDDKTAMTLSAQTHPTLNRVTGKLEERPNIARTPGLKSAKGSGSVPVHPAFRDRHAESLNPSWRELAPDAAGQGPLDGEYRGKVERPVRPSFGMRSRTNDTTHAGPPGVNFYDNAGHGANAECRELGRLIMNEATISGSNRLPDAPAFNNGPTKVRTTQK